MKSDHENTMIAVEPEKLCGFFISKGGDVFAALHTRLNPGCQAGGSADLSADQRPLIV